MKLSDFVRFVAEHDGTHFVHSGDEVWKVREEEGIQNFYPTFKYETSLGAACAKQMREEGLEYATIHLRLQEVLDTDKLRREMDT